jgi:hypothetical protein
MLTSQCERAGESPAERAISTQGKLAGVMTDRIEIDAPGDFSVQSVEEVLDMVAQEFGGATAGNCLDL